MGCMVAVGLNWVALVVTVVVSGRACIRINGVREKDFKVKEFF